MGKVEVNILNQSFTFVGEDEERIRKIAELVDQEIAGVVKEFGIVNTMNAVVMATMRIADNYMKMREKAERVEDRTSRLLRKVEDFEIPYGVRDKW